MAEPPLESWQAPFDDVRWSGETPFPTLAHLSLRLKTFRSLLKRAFPQPTGLRALDIGAGPGHFARVAARQGFDVTALDARSPWTLSSARTSSALPRQKDDFHWIKGDIRDFDDFDHFDVVFAVGLLYHLPLRDQLWLLRRCGGRPMVIDTEVYDAESIPIDRTWRFKPVSTQEGYEGALCVETGNVWSSNHDTESFWFTDDSLPRAFADTGRIGIARLNPAYRSAFGPRRWYVLAA